MFHVAFHDAVQHIIGRQAVLVGLVGTQLGRGRPGDDALGNDLAVAVAPDGQAVDQGLGHVLDDGEAAGHVAVQRAIAGGHLGLVARGQHQAAGLVGQGHQQRAAHPRLDVLFGGVHRQAGELPRQQALEGVHGRADGDVVIAHAQPPRHVGGVDLGNVGGIARGHHDGAHIVGADGVHRHGQHHGRIDAAGQADDGAGETVLAQVITHAQHQRVPDLLFQAVRRHVGLRRGRLDAALGVDLDEIHALGEIGQARRRLAGGVQREGRAVEHQFVLAAHHVGVDQRVAVLAGAATRHFQPLFLLAGVVRRGVGHQQHLGAGLGGGARGSVEPDVLADVDAEAHALDVEHQRFAVSREIALLVEHRIVGQLALAIGAQHAALAQHRGGVVQAALARLDVAHQHVKSGQPGQIMPQAVQHILLGLDEQRAQQQVLGRVAGQDQLGRDQHVGAFGMRLAGGLQHLGGIARQVPTRALICAIPTRAALMDGVSKYVTIDRKIIA